MKVAIVGSRDETCTARMHAVYGAVRSLAPGDVVVSGDAHGCDSWAREMAYECGHVFVRCVAPWSIGRKAGPMRNAVIVELSDRVIAFPAEAADPGQGGGSGTWDCIRQFVKAGKPVEVIHVGGET